MSDKYVLYIIQSVSNGHFYIGQTSDLEKRLKQHNEHKCSGSSSTKRLKGPWELVYQEFYESRSEAMKREKEIKSWKSRKAIISLISSVGRVPTSWD